MAVTSIWAIKGRVDRIIEYARNPVKTHDSEIAESMHKVSNAIQYTTDELKTERQEYVSYINCLPDCTVEQFLETKRRYGKTSGRACYHGYQSFKRGEVTAALAHRIGVSLAQELWGEEFEVVVATHCNTGIYHNHFVLNSVSFTTGYKFRNSPADRDLMRSVSDRLCYESNLSVIRHPRNRRKHYAEWNAEQQGKPTYRGTIRADIDRAILAAVTQQQFMAVMREMGYDFKIYGRSGNMLQKPSLSPPGTDSYFRFVNLGEGYSLEEIADRIYRNNHPQKPFADKNANSRRMSPAYRMKGNYAAAPKIKGLRALYLRYCYKLNIIHNCPASVKRVSFLLREDLIKLDSYIAQASLLGREGIETMSQLSCYREKTESEISSLTEQRTQLRNDLKHFVRSGNELGIASIKAQISEITSTLRTLRKEVGLCNKIEDNSSRVQENLHQLNQQQNNERKEITNNEHIRRCSGPDRQDDTQRR